MATQNIIKKINDLPTIQLPKRGKDLTNKKQGKIIFAKPAQKINNRMYWWCYCECGEVLKLRADSKVQCCKKCRVSPMKGRILKDLTNKKFGKLTVLYPTDKYQNNHRLWHCKCDCGKELDIIGASLSSGNTKSCGCSKKETSTFAKTKKDLTGQKFGYLTALEPTQQRQYGKVVWKCRCDCGKIVYLNTTRLTQGNDTSCGCKKTSLGATSIENILISNSISFTKEYTNKELNKKRYDFAIIENNIITRLIEYDGEQHYYTTGGWNNQQNFQKRIKYDKEKNKYALQHNIPLVRIPYWERDNITLDMVMGDKYLIKEDA